MCVHNCCRFSLFQYESKFPTKRLLLLLALLLLFTLCFLPGRLLILLSRLRNKTTTTAPPPGKLQQLQLKALFILYLNMAACLLFCFFHETGQGKKRKTHLTHTQRQLGGKPTAAAAYTYREATSKHKRLLFLSLYGVCVCVGSCLFHEKRTTGATHLQAAAAAAAN